MPPWTLADKFSLFRAVSNDPLNFMEDYETLDQSVLEAVEECWTTHSEFDPKPDKPTRSSVKRAAKKAFSELGPVVAVGDAVGVDTSVDGLCAKRLKNTDPGFGHWSTGTTFEDFGESDNELESDCESGSDEECGSDDNDDEASANALLSLATPAVAIAIPLNSTGPTLASPSPFPSTSTAFARDVPVSTASTSSFTATASTAKSTTPVTAPKPSSSKTPLSFSNSATTPPTVTGNRISIPVGAAPPKPKPLKNQRFKSLVPVHPEPQKKHRGPQNIAKKPLADNPDAARKRAARAAATGIRLVPVQVPVPGQLLPFVPFSFPDQKQIQQIPLLADEVEWIARQNNMTLLHEQVRDLGDTTLPEQKAHLNVYIVFFGGHPRYCPFLRRLIYTYPKMSLRNRTDIDSIAGNFLTKLQTPRLSTYLSLRRSFWRYADYMEETIAEMKVMIEDSKKAGQPTKLVEELLVSFENYLTDPLPGLHGVKYLKMYGEKPMERKTTQSNNGDMGTKQAVAYHKQAFKFIYLICQAILGENNAYDSTYLASESMNIQAAVGKEYQNNDVDRQSSKRKAALTHDDQVAARRFYLTSGNANPFEGICFLNMGRAMMTRAQERRFTEYLDMDANEQYTSTFTERTRHRVPKMMVTEFIMDKNKLSHLFSKVGQDDKTLVSAGTHRDAAFSVDVSIAQFLFYKHTILGKPWPPFEEGYEGCKRHVLFPSRGNDLKPLSPQGLNKMIRVCYVAIGRYTAGLVTHLERKEGSYWRIALGCPNEEVSDSNWGKGAKEGKKAVYKECYNKGFGVNFIVASTDHGVCKEKEVYFIPWDVEVPETLLSCTWEELNGLFGLVDTKAPGFGNIHSFTGLVRAIRLFKKRLYQGTAHNLYTGIMKDDNRLLGHPNFQSNEFKLVCQRVKESCDAYAAKCASQSTASDDDANNSLIRSEIGISPERRILDRFDTQDSHIATLNSTVQTMMGMMVGMQSMLEKSLGVAPSS
ncbi:hypothetical protein BCR33DRAFT_723920 [Rhizoclosmatium globosum]|uniref:Uncharacterized protein n=1 Tax=Rhizoclosmatium globosum TaxID=329046 RepID=A0A1Y2BAR5_9FUNG|nr:hypothetical protein BCR33DRAFT_723920 [Rhizoclosmatium globosum]|eukprot:ORY31567.1 hypothetical protein BCR33DRAFT_723920 [Rhizoclosmatium globosum]